MTQIRVADVMSTEVVTIGPDETIEIAEQMMHAGRIHHLPVVSSTGRLEGILAQADLLRASVSIFAGLSPDEELEIKRSIPVSRVMSRSVCTVRPSDPAMRAGELILRHKYGCLPVVEGRKLVGILTEGDFVGVAIRALRIDAEVHAGVATQDIDAPRATVN